MAKNMIMLLNILIFDLITCRLYSFGKINLKKFNFWEEIT